MSSVWDSAAPSTGRISNSSFASPGSFISARSESDRSRSMPTTRQKSSVSPNSTFSGCRRPRRRPGPPTSVSIHPRSRQSMSPAYQPLPPPIRQTAANTLAGSALISTERRSEKTVPPAHEGSPGIGPATLHRVSTARASTFRSALAIASRAPIAACGINRWASSFVTTTRFRSPSARGRAIRYETGVTRLIHSELSRGVSTGTGTMSRRGKCNSSAMICINSR